MKVGEVVAAACVIGCHVCSDSRIVQVHVLIKGMWPNGLPRVDVTIDPRDYEVVERFYKIHLSPWAQPATL